MLIKNIPILMYHALTPQEAVHRNNNPIHISVENFANQMQYLAENGYQCINISQLIEYLKTPQTEKLVALTFDDGYYSLLQHATPILLKYKFKATLFLTSGTVNTGGLEDNSIAYPYADRPLTWDELSRMENLCWDIQAHGAKHLAHNMLSYKELFDEMHDCRTEIFKHLEKKAEYYAYPEGRYNTRCLKMLSEMGFKAGFSVHQGMATGKSDQRRLPRIEINQYDTIETFKNKITTGYSDQSTKLKSRLNYLVYSNTYIKDTIKRLKDILK